MYVIGDNIVKTRTELGLSCADLAKRVGTLEIRLRKYELGKEMPGYAMVVRIAKALGVEPHELIHDPNNPYIVTNEADGIYGPKNKREKDIITRAFLKDYQHHRGPQPAKVRSMNEDLDKIDRSTFGGNLKYYRVLNGYSMSELGSMCGLAATTISAYENCGKTPSPETVVNIARALKIPASSLTAEDNTRRNILDDYGMSDYLDEIRNRPEIRALFSLSKDATKEDVDQTLAILETLKKKHNDNE